MVEFLSSFYLRINIVRQWLCFLHGVETQFIASLRRIYNIYSDPFALLRNLRSYIVIRNLSFVI